MRSPTRVVPAEVLWHVPRPDVILLGCTPFDAKAGPCPTCGGSVHDRPDLTGRERPTVFYCGRCDRMDERHSARLAHQRCEAEVSADATDRADRETRELAHLQDGLKGVTLSEAHRRRIWYGYRKSPLAEAEPSGLAVAGRRWLEAIGQLPDWSLILDARGKVVGHWTEDGPHSGP